MGIPYGNGFVNHSPKEQFKHLETACWPMKAIGIDTNKKFLLPSAEFSLCTVISGHSVKC